MRNSQFHGDVQAEEQKLRRSHSFLICYAWFVFIFALFVTALVLYISYLRGYDIQNLQFTLILVLPSLGYALGLFLLIWGVRGFKVSFLSWSAIVIGASYIPNIISFVLYLIQNADQNRQGLDQLLYTMVICLAVFSTFNTILFIGSALGYRAKCVKLNEARYYSDDSAFAPL